MSVDILGPHFDIHGGGMDLKFPHHENEIAQTCAACDSPFVNVWMHNGFVRVDDEKMSKSLGNFFTVREVLEWVRDPEVVRYFIVNSQYRGPINYTPDSLAQADAALERLYLAAARRAGQLLPLAGEVAHARVRAAHRALHRRDGRRLQHADRGVGAAGAGARDQHGKGGRRTRQGGRARRGTARARRTAGPARARAGGVPAQAGAEAGRVRPVGTELKAGDGRCHDAGRGPRLSDADIERLIDERAAARKAKNFKESDRIRDLLAASGVVLEDQPGGKTLWRRG